MTNISLTISIQTLEIIDNNRGDIPRSRYISRLLNSILIQTKNVENAKKMPVDKCLEVTDPQRVIVASEK